MLLRSFQVTKLSCHAIFNHKSEHICFRSTVSSSPSFCGKYALKDCLRKCTMNSINDPSETLKMPYVPVPHRFVPVPVVGNEPKLVWIALQSGRTSRPSPVGLFQWITTNRTLKWEYYPVSLLFELLVGHISFDVVADLVMAIYVFIISSADVAYKAVYSQYFHQWVHGYLCRISGCLCESWLFRPRRSNQTSRRWTILGVISFDTSALLLAFMALERYIRLVYRPFARRGLSLRTAAECIAFCWMTGRWEEKNLMIFSPLAWIGQPEAEL